MSATGRERGSALPVVVLIALVASALVVEVARRSIDEVRSSSRGVRRSTAFQAAEAGVHEYVAKLTEDHQYHSHFVHPAESTRRTLSGQDVAAGQAWPGGPWTYPRGKDAWRQLPGGRYEYNLQVKEPDAASNVVRIVATGRRAGSPMDWRAVETHVRPATIADFFRIVNGDISWGAGASTYGKLYAGIDGDGVAHNIEHRGTAHADVYAEGEITHHPTYVTPARGYDGTTIRTAIRNPINFNAFTTSLVSVERAAGAAGLRIPHNSSYDGWKVVFSGAGSVSVAGCNRTSSKPLAEASPTCAAPTVYPMPVNGAIYSSQKVIVSGTVNGRVTVASSDDVIVGADISYVQPGDDVLGLIAVDELIVARWSPSVLTWRAAVLVQTETWHTYDSSGNHSTMNFTGSSATNKGGWMTMFATRNYVYDTNLQFLQPPWFPVLEDAYTILFFRELTP